MPSLEEFVVYGFLIFFGGSIIYGTLFAFFSLFMIMIGQQDKIPLPTKFGKAVAPPPLYCEGPAFDRLLYKVIAQTSEKMDKK